MKHKIEIIFETPYSQKEYEENFGSLNMANFMIEKMFLKTFNGDLLTEDLLDVNVVATFEEE